MIPPLLPIVLDTLKTLAILFGSAIVVVFIINTAIALWRDNDQPD